MGSRGVGTAWVRGEDKGRGGNGMQGQGKGQGRTQDNGGCKERQQQGRRGCWEGRRDNGGKGSGGEGDRRQGRDNRTGDAWAKPRKGPMWTWGVGKRGCGK